ncbi:MAG TPA: gamma-glutamyltransferase [Chitinophagaceae bacterium]|nr:gamma-glutamyltransferase [Chitinophagaceae bacterium]
MQKLKKRSKKYLLVIACFFISVDTLFAQTKFDPYHYAANKNVTCKNGVVVSAHALASEVGVNILKQGGNAVDAAIATQFALAVVYPGAGNIGGGGFMVIHLKNGKNITVDYRETAPAAATRDMYLDAKGNPEMNLSQNGHLSAGVPGSVAGMTAALKYAKLPLKKLIQPAIDLAENGFAITGAEARSLNGTRDEFIKLNTVTPVFVKEVPWKSGDTLIQHDLAKTLRLIRDRGAKGFYEGETARLVAEEMKRGHGIMTEEDLKNYAAKIREPLTFNYEGYTIVSMPLPSSGGIIIEQCLKMSHFEHLSGMKFETPESVQLMVEAERRSFADRAQFLGDPDFVKVPVKTLVSDAYLKQRLSDYVPGKAGNSKDVSAGQVNEREETTHFDVLDKEGNAVSVTTTLNGGYGSRTVVAGAGFLLNNEMDDFSVKPGVPNMYGAVGAEANSIMPGKRMLSSMTPVIVLKNGKPFVVVGTPGGTTIPTSVYQSLVDVIDFKMPPDDVVNKPKFHHQWLPDVIFVEKGFDGHVKDRLEKMGYKVIVREAIGRTELVELSKNGTITAVADHRGDDSAAGY